MATSGTAVFNMEFTEIAEEAWERAGREMRSGYDLRTARRANRGINMWTIEEGYIDLVQGQAEYDLPDDTIDLLEHVVRTGSGSYSTQQDITISRISVSTYASIPNKQTQGRPIQVKVERLRDNPRIVIWPVPNQGTALDPYYLFVYWRLRRIEDAGSGVQTPDMNFRFYPALVAGLAYYIAMKVPELTDRIPMLKSIYDEQYDLAGQEDREKAPVRFVPRSPRR